MNSAWYKKVGIIGIVLMILSGCGGQKEIEIAKDAQGLPSAEELIQKSAEQFSLMKSFRVSDESEIRRYDDPQDKESAHKWRMTGELEYVREPFAYHTKTTYETKADEFDGHEIYFATSYGTYRSSEDEGKWLQDGKGDEDDVRYAHADMQAYEQPYKELESLEQVEMSVEHEGENYKLIVTGEEHSQDSQEGLFDPVTGKEYTLVITTDKLSIFTYIIDSATLLPIQKIDSTDIMQDYSGETSYSDFHGVVTYDHYNKVNDKKLVKETRKIAKRFN